MSRSLYFSRATVLMFALNALGLTGCDSKSATAPPAASGDLVVTKPDPVPETAEKSDTPMLPVAKTDATTRPQPGNNAPPSSAGPDRKTSNFIVPVQRPQPSDMQIAKWGPVAGEPLQLLACYDGFDEPAAQCMAITPDGKQFASAVRN